ncbi:MAG: protein rep [Bdellovibrionales bacterium]
MTAFPSAPANPQKDEKEAYWERHQKRLNRLAKAHARQTLILSYLEQLQDASRHETPDMLSLVWGDIQKIDPNEDLGWLISRLGNCGRWLGFRHYKETGQLRLFNSSMCRKVLLCPFCAIQRSAKHLQTYMPKFLAVREAYPNLIPVLITLTEKNGPDLEERVDHLFSSLNTVKGKRRNAKNGGRCKSELNKVIGAVGSFEISNSCTFGWHPHLHMIAFIDELIDPFELSKEWLAITGDSKIVDVRRIDESNLIKSLNEVFKYSLKFGSLTPSQTYECHKVLRNRKKLFSLGIMRNVHVEKNPDEVKLQEMDYEDLQYTFRDGLYVPANPAAKKKHGA